MILTSEMLDALVEAAKVSPRLRQNMDMRTQTVCPAVGHEDASQRMLNAIEPGSVVPVHRHPHSTETVIVLRGAVRQSFYEVVDEFEQAGSELPMGQDAGDVLQCPGLRLVEQIVVEAGSPCPMYVVSAGVWHSTEALVSGTIIFEAKDGRYGEDESENFD